VHDGAGVNRMRTWLRLLLCFSSACTGPAIDYDEPQDADDNAVGDGKADATACSFARCGDPEASNILFPGNPACSGGGCERRLASADLYVPPTNGKPWGDTYLLGTAAPYTLSGYSSGRIALLRRLGLVGDGVHAVMVDPSWPDGERDFLGRGPERGEDIVRDWLLADPARTFTLVYSTRSIGWENYAALRASDEVGVQVRVCATGLPHLLVPTEPDLHTALVEPPDFDNGRCD
jgi:hypothetical protein